MANALSDLYASLRTEADLQRLIDEHTCEGLHLEFKEKRDRASPELHANDARQFSRALSGFANSDGGIMIWGIATTKEDGLDYASERKAIVSHETFTARLRKSLLEAVVPMVDGVEIDPVPSVDPKVGYVKCLIPRSELTPHRASADHEYYKRSVEGFYRLEHFDLEDMFGRRPLPKLSLVVRLIEAGASSSVGVMTYRGWAVVEIANSGRGSARAPYLVMTVSSNYGFINPGIHNRTDGLTRYTTADPNRLVFTSADVVIHPDLTHEVTSIHLHTNVEHGESVVLPPDLRITYRLGAENAQLIENAVTVDRRDIARVLLPESLWGRMPAV